MAVAVELLPRRPAAICGVPSVHRATGRVAAPPLARRRKEENLAHHLPHGPRRRRTETPSGTTIAAPAPTPGDDEFVAAVSPRYLPDGARVGSFGWKEF